MLSFELNSVRSTSNCANASFRHNRLSFDIYATDLLQGRGSIPRSRAKVLYIKYYVLLVCIEQVFKGYCLIMFMHFVFSYIYICYKPSNSINLFQ